MSTQIRLHDSFRRKMKELKVSGTAGRAVMTFHFNNPPTPDYLSVCLDVPSIQEPTEPKVEVEPAMMNLHSLIIDYVNEVCRQNQIEMKTYNYRLEIEEQKKVMEEKGEPYYDGAPVDEILRFASIGTQIALDVLNSLEQNRNIWDQDLELAKFVESRLQSEFGLEYTWIEWAWHFACNPLLINEGYLTTILNAHSNQALNAILSRLNMPAEGGLS